MAAYRFPLLLLGALTVFGCTSDPDAAVNQNFPIPQMDALFGSPHQPPPVADDYTHKPGYLPAYPTY